MEWLKAEEVDWYAANRALKEESSKRQEPIDASSATDSKALDEQSIKRQRLEDQKDEGKAIVITSLTESEIKSHIDKARSDVNSVTALAKAMLQSARSLLGDTPSRDVVDSCAIFVSAFPKTAIEQFVLPLLSFGSRSSCAVTEGILESKTACVDREAFAVLASSFKETLCENEDQLLFWQRCFFGRKVPVALLEKLIREMDAIPAGSPRVAGAVFALTKTNGSSLAQFSQMLLSILSRSSGVMVGAAKKAIVGLSSK